MTRTLLSIAAGPILFFLATLSLLSATHRRESIEHVGPPAAPLIEPLPNGLSKGPRLVATVSVVSFVHRWEPVEQIKPLPPPLPAPPPTVLQRSDPPPHHAAPSRPRDICARHGGHRVNYIKSGHAYWRCAYPHRA